MGQHNASDPVHPRPDQSTQSLRTRVLLADDDAEMRALLRVSLRAEGYEVLECRDGMQLLAQLNPVYPLPVPQRFDLVITDMRMPGVSGLDLLRRLHGQSGVPPIILITAFGDAQTHTQARQLGATAIIDKPFEMIHLLTVVRAVLALSIHQTQ